MGFLMMNGVSCATPDEHDPRKENVNFYAIYQGRQLAVRVLSGNDGNGSDSVKFSADNDFEGLTNIAVVKTGPFSVDIFRLTDAAISKFGKRKGGWIEVAGNYSAGSLRVQTEEMSAIRSLSSILA